MPFASVAQKNNASNAYSLDRSKNVRDIADAYPGAGDLARREACGLDFRLFCDSYFPNAFTLAWSDDHLKAIAKMQSVILDGGLFALAMPRGAGKTTLTVRAALWGLLYGHRRFLCLIGPTEDHAAKLLKQFKQELMYNDELGRDFRQVCYPIQRLENNGRKAIGQIFNGAQTNIEWSTSRLTFPTMPDTACDGPNVSGHTISVAGLTGAIRGQSSMLPDGTIIRPEVVILDDPQTRESAMSLSQSAMRAEIIKGDVLGMAGPGQGIAAIMPCTVIRRGDMADRLLDRKHNPEWGGQLTKMVYAFPDDEKLWAEYREIRVEAQENERGPEAENQFYADHRDAMDAGSVVAWPARHKPTELSAIQHAMNLRFSNEHAFWAEYQNSPLSDDESDPGLPTVHAIASKVNRQPRHFVPLNCRRVTAFVDVQKDLLYYTVCAWEDDFTGYVIDYGAYPDQQRAYFSLREAKSTLATACPKAGLEGQIYAGLECVAEKVVGREYACADGAPLSVTRCMIDANWGQSTEVVRRFCRQSKYASVLTPSHGHSVGAAGRPMSEWQKRPGEKAGLNWRLRVMGEGRGARSVVFDPNYWKSFVAARLNTAMGDRGCLSLFGEKPEAHRLFADHLTSEFRVRTEGRGRVVDDWKHRPERPDNHWLDCVVGCAVAASLEGASIAESRAGVSAPRQKMTIAEMKQRRSQPQSEPTGGRHRVTIDELKRQARGA